MVSNLPIRTELKKWHFIANFSLKTRTEAVLFEKYDSIVFYTHPFNYSNITKQKSWGSRLKKLVQKIRNHFKGSIYLITPFKENRISKYNALSDLVLFCKNINIIYLSLQQKDYFSKTFSHRQGQILDQFLTNLQFKQMNLV